LLEKEGNDQLARTIFAAAYGSRIKSGTTPFV